MGPGRLWPNRQRLDEAMLDEIADRELLLQAT